MNKLYKRELEKIVNDLPVKRRFSIGKWIYITLLLLTCIGASNYFFGDALFLRAEGLVLRDRYEIQAIYDARVKSVSIEAGDKVQKGDIIAELESATMLRDIAEFSVKNTTLSMQFANLKTETAKMLDMLPLAEKRVKHTMATVAKVKELATQELASSERVDQTIAANYEANSNLAELKSSIKVLNGEFSRVQQSFSETSAALKELKKIYNGGKVLAPETGIVGIYTPNIGEVVKNGDNLTHLYAGKWHILAYMPNYYLFEVKTGDELIVKSGNAKAIAVVDEILSVADALPPEFQNTFKPRERRRLLRLSIKGKHKFAISQKVEISTCDYFLCLDKIAEHVVDFTLAKN